MKLRNKKTGEIAVCSSIKVYGDEREDVYENIYLLCSDWEDVKEPLIKDEKIRKAVRTWVETNHINGQMIKASTTPKRISFIGWIDATIGGFSIDFLSSDKLGVFRDGEHYTVEELCGEEE